MISPLLKIFFFRYTPYPFRKKVYSMVKRKRFQKYSILKHQVVDNYTFKSFYELKCIFVHVPKTAGISVSTQLFGNLAGGHTRLVEYQMIFNEKEFDSFFKFAFVRNPWARLLSAYNFLKKGGANRLNLLWAKKHLTQYQDFSDFVSNGLHKKEIFTINHFKPQSEFITLPHESGVRLDYLAYLENIKQDFKVISSQVLNNPTIVLPHINKSSETRRPYYDFYNERTRGIVAELYGRDIDLLGYEFERPISRQQLLQRDASFILQ